MTNEYCVICGKQLPEHKRLQGKKTCSRSCAVKLSYQNPEVRLAHKEAINRPEVRQKMSVGIKRAFANGASEKLSKAMKRKWSEKEYRDKTYSAIVKGCRKPESRLNSSIASKKVWEDNDYRNKRIEDMNKEDNKKKHREAMSLWYEENCRNNETYKHNHTSAMRKLFSERKDEIMQKQYMTKKKHNTLGTSKQEKYSVELLKSIFGENDIETQYNKDKRYPYRCDIYVTSKDLFIECNYFWHHGGAPFDLSVDWQQKQYNDWTEKAKISKSYRIALDVWSRRDVDKIKMAKENNLNYLTFYSLQEFIKYFSSL